jgi:hypothetical protein
MEGSQHHQLKGAKIVEFLTKPKVYYHKLCVGCGIFIKEGTLCKACFTKKKYLEQLPSLEQL